MCNIQIKRCIRCKNDHYFSYAIDLKTKTKYYYHDSHNYKYFQLTNEVVIEKRLLSLLMSDIMFKQSSFRAFADSYNNLFYRDTICLEPKRLTEAFYAYNLLKFRKEAGLTTLTCIYSYIYNFLLLPNF